jgi:hypothetical protein
LVSRKLIEEFREMRYRTFKEMVDESKKEFREEVERESEIRRYLARERKKKIHEKKREKLERTLENLERRQKSVLERKQFFAEVEQEDRIRLNQERELFNLRNKIVVEHVLVFPRLMILGRDPRIEGRKVAAEECQV